MIHEYCIYIKTVELELKWKTIRGFIFGFWKVLSACILLWRIQNHVPSHHFFHSFSTDCYMFVQHLILATNIIHGRRSMNWQLYHFGVNLCKTKLRLLAMKYFSTEGRKITTHWLSSSIRSKNEKTHVIWGCFSLCGECLHFFSCPRIPLESYLGLSILTTLLITKSLTPYEIFYYFPDLHVVTYVQPHQLKWWF